MKRNGEAQGGGTDQQWLLRLDVFGFDLQTELQINATPRGKSKIQMTRNLYTLRSLGMIMFKDDWEKKEKRKKKSVMHLQTNRETKRAGKASPQSAAPAATFISFYAFIPLNTEVLQTYAYKWQWKYIRFVPLTRMCLPFSADVFKSKAACCLDTELAQTVLDFKLISISIIFRLQDGLRGVGLRRLTRGEGGWQGKWPGC